MEQVSTGELAEHQTLDSITNDLHDIEALFDNAEGDEDLALLLDAYLQSDEARLQKLDRYAAMIGAAQARATFRQAEADRLRALASVDTNKAKSAKARLAWYFEQENLPKQQTPHYVISLAGNGGLAPLVVDAEKVPHEYCSRVMTGRQYAELDNILAELKTCTFLTHEVIDALTMLIDDIRMSPATLENAAIREALASGAELPFAHLADRGKSIRIK
jgi:hypothetical protein